VPVEVATPYTENYLRKLHFTQSVDVLFLFQPFFNQRTLSRVSDTAWFLSPVVYDPPPSFEADSDISEGDAAIVPPAGALIAIIAPLAGTVSGDTTVTASVRPGVGVSSVRFEKNTIPFGPVITTFPYSFIWGTDQELDLITYTLTAILTEALGPETTSAGVIVTVVHGGPGGGGSGGGESPGDGDGGGAE